MSTDIISLYAAGKSLKNIGFEVGLSTMTIRSRLLEAGVTLRKPGSGKGHYKTGSMMCMGYVWLLRPAHPLADKDGYVMRAIINWEEANGRPFPEGKTPHHDNEDKTDDRPENIVPLTQSEHVRLHHLRHPWNVKRTKVD